MNSYKVPFKKISYGTKSTHCRRNTISYVRFNDKIVLFLTESYNYYCYKFFHAKNYFVFNTLQCKNLNKLGIIESKILNLIERNPNFS